MALGSGVKKLHPEYEKRVDKWKRCRDVIAGQDAVHAGRGAYLKRLKDEDDESYAARIDRTPFFNASWRTVASFVGMLFRKPPTLEVPAGLEPLLEDVTAGGVSFDEVAQSCAYEDLTVSRLGIFVDHPTQVINADGSTLTVAEAERLGLRPSMTVYPTESIRNWDYRRINNRKVLSQVRLAEIARIEESEFEFKEEAQIKVLDLEPGSNLYRIRIFKEETEEQVGGDVYPTINGQRLDFIPFYFIGADGTDGTVDDPVMIDLFDHNLKHYSVAADYEHACHMTALPTPWIAGYQWELDEQGKPKDTKFYIGSTTAWVFPDANTKVDFLEYTGAGIASIKANLDDKKSEMAAIGARMLAPEKTGVEAAETLIIRNTGEHSILAAVAVAISRGLSNALKTFALWADKPGGCKFEINRDFMPFSIDPQALTAWMAAVQSGNMDKESLFDLMKRGDLLDTRLTFEEWQTRLEENPPMPPPVAAPVDPKTGKPLKLGLDGKPLKQEKEEVAE
jgi:hypothetical protein